MPDFVVFNAENGGFGVTGQNLTYLANLTTGAATAYFYTDADLNSGNVIMTVPMPRDAARRWKDDRFRRLCLRQLLHRQPDRRDRPACASRRAAPASASSATPFGTVAAQGSADLGVTTATLPDAMSSELGLLMMYRRNAGQEADAFVSVEPGRRR